MVKKILCYLFFNFLIIFALLSLEILIFNAIALTDENNIWWQVKLAINMVHTFVVTLFLILIINFLLLKRSIQYENRKIFIYTFVCNLALFIISVYIDVVMHFF
jgi:hypothetical protein